MTAGEAMGGAVPERPGARAAATIDEALLDLHTPLRLLCGCAERLGALGVPVAQVYARAAEISLVQAVAAAAHARDADRRRPEAVEEQAMDPRLIEWLE